MIAANHEWPDLPFRHHFVEREAREICPKPGPKVNFTEVIREMKAR